MATAGVWARVMMEESTCVPGKTGLFGSMRLGFIVLRRVRAEQAEVLRAWSAQRESWRRGTFWGCRRRGGVGEAAAEHAQSFREH